VKPSWDTLSKSRNNDEGTLVHQKEQFRNVYKTYKEQIAHAPELLYVFTCQYKTDSHTQVGDIVYHGGTPLAENNSNVFFVSKNRADAEQYGEITVYRITKELRVHSILWDQLAANYGVDVNFSPYDMWENLVMHKKKLNI
jgi:hypothetical protein